MGDNKHHMLLWLDVETTAINPADGQLLEIGMRITELDGTYPDCDNGAVDFAFERPLHKRVVAYTAATAHAIRMHQDNGLLDEVATPQTPPVDDEKQATLWLSHCIDVLQDGKPPVVLHVAGSNPAFDRAWLDERFPGLPDSDVWADSVSYRNLDLSAIRLTLLTVGLDPYGRTHTGTHRVHDCLDRDMREWGQWVDWVGAHKVADGYDPDGSGPSLAARFGLEGDQA